MRRTLSFAALLLVTGCVASERSARVPVEDLASSNNAQRATEGIVVARSESELEALWLLSGRFDDPPEIDFRQEMVIAYFMGARGTGGYLAAITGASTDGRVLAVDVRKVSPGAGCIVTQATTSPAALVRTMHMAGPVTLGRVESRVSDCR